MSTSHVCAHGHRWQLLAACPVCGAAPQAAGEPTVAEAGLSRTLPADAVPPPVAVLATLQLPARASEGGAPAAELPRVHGYEILEVLGRGGMGVVYLAWQTELARLVALKTVLAGAHAGPGQRARFRTEAEAAARLQHPHIVQIHEVGEADGQPYLVMEYVEGGNLAAWLDGRPQPWRSAAAFVAILAGAVQHAHQRGIVHRDLKPANILLVSGGVVSGEWSEDATHHSPLTTHHPKITDFGLAKLVVGGVTQTATGAILGTPGYMAPEQAAAASEPVGPAADVHALGAILYEMLTGRRPFEGAGVLETLEQVRSQEPVSPRRLVATVPRDLETVCLKCLHKAPARRYESAAALAEDLRRCAAGEPVRARPVSPWERAAKWLRRNPARAALLAVSCLAALALTAAAVGLAYNARLQALNGGLQNAARQAEAARAEAERQRAALGRLERWVRYVRDVHLADEAWHNGQLRRLSELLDGCPPDLRGWEWDYLRGLAGRGGRELDHWAGVLAVAFCPGGRCLASSCTDGSVYFWDLATGAKRLAAEHHQGGVWGVAFSPDGRLLASAGEDRLVRLWDPRDGRLVRRLAGHGAAVRCVAFSRTGRELASAGKDGTIKLWDLNRGRERRSLRGHAGGVLALAFAPDGRRLASGGADGVVRLWDPDQGVEVRPLPGHQGDVRGIAFSRDGQVLASVGADGTLRTWDPAGGRELAVYHPGQTTALNAVAFGPQGQMAVAAEDRHVLVWTGSLLQTLRGHNHRVEGVAYSPDGRYVASASRDWKVRLWEVVGPQDYRAFPAQNVPVLGAHFSLHGRSLTDAAQDGTVRVWDVESGRLLYHRAAHLNRPRGVAFRPDGRLLAAAGRHGTVAAYDPVTDKAVSGGWRHGVPVRAVAFSADGRRLASTGDVDGTVKVWDAAGGRYLFTGLGHTPPVRAVAFSPDGRVLASGGEDRVRLWDVATGQELPPLPEDTRKVVALAFGPDGRLAVAQMGGHITLWDADRRRCSVPRLIGHSAMVWSLAFTPDGTRLASASRDMTVKLWDTASGQEVLTLRDFASEVSGVAFSPDGRRLVTTDLGGSVRLYEIGRRD